MVKKIKILPPERNGSAEIKNFAAEIKAPEFVAEGLYRLGIETAEEARHFFVPHLEGVHPPQYLRGMEEGLDIAEEALQNGGKILIHGDYDVDGLCGTTLLTEALRRFGFTHVTPFVPNRFKEGYGICRETIESFARRGYRYLFTVDTGITALGEIELAVELGMKVVVMDHHQQTEELPPAQAILNPQQKSCDYPNVFLCGTGVALKFIEGLSQRLDLEMPFLLDLFLLGTLADMMPVVGENRIYLKNALHNLFRCGRPGVKALLEEAQIQEDNVRAQDILFRVTPLINAVGRMGDPSLALDLLLSKHPAEAKRLVAKMKEANLIRRETEGKLYEEILAQIEKDADLLQQKVLIVGGRSFHQGVIGIVAARLIEKYQKPVAIISVDNEGMGRASARSVDGFNWPLALAECAEWLPKWGGHYYAAGFNVREENISKLRARLNEIADRIEFKPEQIREIQTDFAIEFEEIDSSTMEWLQRFEPFGAQNEMPVFFTEQVFLGGECRVVGGSHLKLKIQNKGRYFDAIAFGMGEWADVLKDYQGAFDIAFRPVWNHFRNKKMLQLQISGIQIPVSEVASIA